MDALCTNRRRSNRADMEFTHRGRGENRLPRVQCRQSQALLAQRRPDRQRMHACSISRLLLRQTHRNNAIRNRRWSHRVFCAADLPGRLARSKHQLPKSFQYRANGSRRRNHHAEFVAYRGQRTWRCLHYQLHLRQMNNPGCRILECVTQIVVIPAIVRHTAPTFLYKPSSQEPNPAYSDLRR